MRKQLERSSNVLIWCVLMILTAAMGGCATLGETAMMHAKPGVATVETGFINKVVEVEGVGHRYVTYVPRDYDAEEAWPLVVFLHGAGERGDDGLKQTEVGIGKAVRLHPDRFPCLIVMPQCPEKSWWDTEAEQVEAAVRQVAEEYRVDPDRIYLTGLSMGGFGTWIHGAQKTDVFAALMPICGGGRVEDAEALAKLPIWAFHGADDEVVLPDETRKMVEAVKAAGGDVRYTEYEKTGHNSWDKAYDDAATIKWLLRQKRHH